MKRAAFLIAFLLTAVSCATTQPDSRVALARAVQAMGGTDALAGIETKIAETRVNAPQPAERIAIPESYRKKAGIAPLRFAGGHGAVADYPPLAALDGK